jgi:peptidoglycan-associated lipoprotein
MGAHVRTLVLATFGVLVVLQMGCSKSIQANAGSKSLEHQPAKPVMAASNRLGAESVLGEPQAGPKSLNAASSRNGASSLSDAPSLNPQGDDRSAGDVLIAKVEPSDAARRQVEDIKEEQAATAMAGLMDVYFPFDSWNITEDGRQALQSDAEWLRTNPGKMLLIEGHCDERGTQAYNLVLGEKRAKAMRNFLVELGVTGDRLKTVSYGKDRPFCRESDEACYRQNRRGHVVVRVH